MEHLNENFLTLYNYVVQKQFFKFIDKESHLLKVSEGWCLILSQSLRFTMELYLLKSNNRQAVKM